MTTVDLCKNCGTELKGEFCHTCGQSSRVIRRPFRDLLYDISNHLLQWDNRLLRTLKLLYLKPGSLSSEWSDGKRMHYTPPFRMYLIASFILFLVIGMSRGDNFNFTELPPEADQAKQDIDQAIRDASNDGDVVLSSNLEGITLSNGEISKQLEKAISNAENDGDWLGAVLLNGINEAVKDPQGYFRKIKTNLPKAAFLLLPIFGLLHGLVEIRRNRYLIDYLVFSLHFHAFAFSLIAFIVLLGVVYEPLGGFAQLLYLWIPVYVLLGMRRFNDQGWLKGIIKSALIMGAYVMILGLMTGLYFTFFLFV